VELFSQRKGIKPVKSVMQVDSMDEDLKNGLWNILYLCCWSSMDAPHGTHPTLLSKNPEARELVTRLWCDYFKWTLDTRGDQWMPVLKGIKDYYFNCEWYEVYDFIEFVARNHPDVEVSDALIERCNSILEREVSAYRFVGGRITQMTSEEEIAEIEKALEVPLAPIQEHLNRSLSMLADRQNPDYRNSIKEAISAVESMCRIITKDESATLGQALGKVETKVRLHPALKSAFSKLYGYTSDEGGIRHALMDQPNISFEDARFMLVSCSTFINYLMEKSSKAGIQL